jgi:phenylacetate-CoA ligase
MTPLTAYNTYRRMLSAQSLDRAAIRETQARKLRTLVRRAYQRIPYYRTLFEERGISPAEIMGIEDLARIPISTKAALREAPPGSLIDASLKREHLTVERSSGSTGMPFATYYDQAFRSIRNLMFLRGLKATGYRLHDKLLLITSAKPGRWSHRLLRWHYASVEHPATKLCETFHQLSPHFVYGCATSLRMLAEEIIAKKHPAPHLRGVITTAETLDRVTRQLLSSAFGCAVFDFYGMSEMGLVGWECTEHRGYHISDDTLIVEAIPLEEAGNGLHRLVMTNLEAAAMPFIRYDSGDIAQVESDGSCRCGNRFSLLKGIEGRVADCIRLPGGRRLSPYMLTCRLELLPGIDRYQVIQEDHDSLTIRVQMKDRRGTCPTEAIRETIGAVVGSQTSIVVEQMERSAMLSTSLGRRTRVVECKL